MREALLTIHILAVAAWFGGGLFGSLAFTAMASRIGLKKVSAVDEAIGAKYFGVAMTLVLLSGVGLVLDNESVRWGDAFVLIGIGVIVLDGVVEGLVGPRMKRIAEAEDEDLTAFKRVSRLSATGHAVLLGFAAWAMVVNLGS